MGIVVSHGAARAAFLDRDGVLVRNVFYPDTGHYEGPRSTADLELYPWTNAALEKLIGAGYLLFIVSNQPNFAKGKGSVEGLRAIHEQLMGELRVAGIELTQSYYCFHHPQSVVPGYGECECRKPSPKFLLDARDRYGVDLSQSWMIGDRATDVECGLRAGVRTIRVKPDHPGPNPRVEKPQADHLVENLLAAAALIAAER